MTPSGKVLCAEPGRSSCGGRRVCDPVKAHEKWRALPEEERRPGAVVVEDLKEMDPKFPRRPAGSLLLKGYNRPMERTADGEVRRVKEYWDCQELSADSVNWKKFAEPEPGRTWVWLTREQWKALVPANPAVGTTVPMAAEAADRLVRLPILNTIY